MLFGSVIIKWYGENKRDLPWRATGDPYLIWLSEVILQQTRVEQGLAYYNRFVENYPTVERLAAASEKDVLKLWQGLGYYSRARNLHAAARQIVKEFGGKFPASYDEIRSLRGIGDYTASAIASFAFNQEFPVVDGNVYRLLSRYFGVHTPIDTAAGKKEFSQLAYGLIKGFPPAIYNQAIMEFGSKQCKPANPMCENCPLLLSCYAYSNNTIRNLPVKKNKVKTRNRYFHYLVLRNQNSFFIRRRNAKDIWQGLHDFPLIESDKRLTISSLSQMPEWKKMFSKRSVKPDFISREYKHILSHQIIYAVFYAIELKKISKPEKISGWIKVNKSSVKKYAVPRLIEKYLKENKY